MVIWCSMGGVVGLGEWGRKCLNEVRCFQQFKVKLHSDIHLWHFHIFSWQEHISWQCWATYGWEQGGGKLTSKSTQSQRASASRNYLYLVGLSKENIFWKYFKDTLYRSQLQSYICNQSIFRINHLLKQMFDWKHSWAV